MTQTHLLLLRHGETYDNQNLVFQGQGGHGLNERGRDQASRLAERLSVSGIHFDALYCSDLERARETAEILGPRLGLVPRPEPGLREVYLGAWEGLSHTEIARSFPEEWSLWRAGADFKRGGGESYQELGERVFLTVDRLMQESLGQTILMVSHGAAIKTFVARVLGLGMDRLRTFRVAANTAITLFERRADGVYHLLVWNDASHLQDPLVQILAPSSKR